MAPKYQDWLAAQVINEGNPVTYRSLSRALKVHSNAAKEMLYDFHRTQNARKHGSIHATYLLCGTRKVQAPPATNGHSSNSQSDGDILMSDISFMSSSMPGQDVESEVEVIPVTTITLVKEEDLEAVKESYERLESIHVYSLEPSTLKNVQVLSECNRKITVDYASDDLLQTWKQYGTIYNPLAKRRTGARPPPPPPVSKPAAAAAPAKTTTKAPTPDPVTKPTLSRTTSTKSDASTSKKTTATTSKPPTLKKESSSIFAAFAAKPRSTTKPTRSTSASQASAAASPAAEADTTMLDAEDEGDEEDPFAGNALDKAKADESRAARSEREANLRKMMEADDDEDGVAPDAKVDEDEVMAEEGETSAPVPLEPTADGQGLKQQSPGAAGENDGDGEPTVTVTNGRRRGRRRVMKKKTTKDAEGYLVTKEEMGWESFSESDREPEKKKVKEAVAAKPVAGGAGGKKGAGAAAKKGQGNIMSFFSKK